MNKNSLTNLPEPCNGGHAPGTLHHVMRCGIKETKIFKFITSCMDFLIIGVFLKNQKVDPA